MKFTQDVDISFRIIPSLLAHHAQWCQWRNLFESLKRLQCRPLKS